MLTLLGQADAHILGCGGSFQASADGLMHLALEQNYPRSSNLLTLVNHLVLQPQWGSDKLGQILESCSTVVTVTHTHTHIQFLQVPTPG